MVTKEKTGVLLSSDRSMEISLESIKNGNAGLNKHRLYLLSKVPASNELHRFSKDSITIKDIAYLSAKTGHEFALLRGKKEDILYHGMKYYCNISGPLVDLLKNGHLRLIAHSHPAEHIPTPSVNDRKVLKLINQKESIIISAITGKEITFSSDRFEL